MCIPVLAKGSTSLKQVTEEITEEITALVFRCPMPNQ